VGGGTVQINKKGGHSIAKVARLSVLPATYLKKDKEEHQNRSSNIFTKRQKSCCLVPSSRS